MKPILFNTEMVRAILEDRKTVTRRVVKPQPKKEVDKIALERFHKPYRPGDILYVRETWARSMAGTYLYKATDTPLILDGWCPSIHMPREAARIFLRVTDVRVERLQNITDDDIAKEGVQSKKGEWLRIDFADLWNSTLKPADLALYGWDANPWVWVIEFERISKEEAEHV